MLKVKCQGHMRQR